MLDRHAEEAFEAAQDGAVQHHGNPAAAVFRDVFGVQPFRQHEIDLQGAALPVAADRVAQHELQLGAVEGAFAGVQMVSTLAMRQAWRSASSAWSHTSSLPTRCSGRSENFTRKSS